MEKVYVIIKEKCTNFEIPDIYCAVFDSYEKAKNYIEDKYKIAISEDYKNEYKEFLETPDEREREQKGLFEFYFDKENCGFEIYKNGAYNEEHYCIYVHKKEIE